MQVNQDPSDGVVRSVSLLFDTEQGMFLPALSLAAVAQLRNKPAPPIGRPDGVDCGGSIHSHGVADSRWCSTSPRSSRSRRTRSPALKVLDGTFDPKSVAGKIVFIGATDPLSGDVRLAPTNKSSRLPGVFLHANAANTMLTGTYLEESTDTTTLLWVAFLTVARRPARAHAPVVAVALDHHCCSGSRTSSSSSGASTTV